LGARSETKQKPFLRWSSNQIGGFSEVFLLAKENTTFETKRFFNKKPMGINPV